MNKFCLAVLAAALAPTAAFAQTAAIGGPFIGGQIGYGERSIDLDVGVGTDFDQSRSGIDYGAYVGYDAALGQNFILGVEAGIGSGGKTLSQTIEGIAVTADPEWNYDISARAGFLAGNALLYGRLGYGGEKLDVSAAAGDLSLGDSGWSEGMILGAGAEIGINEAASVRAEYRHRDMDGDYSANQVLAGLSFRF